MKSYLKYLPFLFLVGCAGLQKDCASCEAENFGGDWIIVQYAYDGHPINCWNERGASISNEKASDGIFWTHKGNLIHISGWYNRVQVYGGNYVDAEKSLNIDLTRCVGGAYKSDPKSNCQCNTEER